MLALSDARALVTKNSSNVVFNEPSDDVTTR
jgi:hypothetical protein